MSADYSTTSATNFLNYWTSFDDDSDECENCDEDVYDISSDDEETSENHVSQQPEKIKQFVQSYIAKAVKDRTVTELKNLCSICFEPFEDESSRIVLPDCDHTFCLDCIKSYFDVCGFDIANLRIVNYETCIRESPQTICVSQFKRIGLRCPSYQCGEVIDRSTFHNFLSPAKAQALRHICTVVESAEHDLKADKQTKQCKSCGSSRLITKIPSPYERSQMQSTGVKVATGIPRTFCENCLNFLCSKCLFYLHDESKPCQSTSERFANELCAKQDFLDWIAKSNTVTMCPHCNATIERSMGCDHMTCSFCRSHFTFSRLSIHQVIRNSVFRFAKVKQQAGVGVRRRRRQGARRRGLITTETKL